ncbi:MAG: glycoside hydrolase family 3 N-terminal domain-containing protein [Gemmatimonadota bacterium]
MNELAQLLLPAIRWDAERGFDAASAEIERALAIGVGGFIVFGGDSTAVAALTAQLRAASGHPLLIAADLERGAGQQFVGCTQLPPLAAIGSLGDALAPRVAGRLTAREALALGVNWTYAPVADLDLEPNNPIVGTRSLGDDPVTVSAAVSDLVEALQEEGMLACAKHFPGHGRTTTDSHAVLPVVHASREELQLDLAPFIAAIDAGVASIMTAHVAYPAFDPSGAPATCSRAIVHGLLRETLGFEGLIVTDALIMGGVQEEGGEGHAATRAITAGCDLLLYPASPSAALHGLQMAAGRTVSRAQLDASLARRDHWARWAATPDRARPLQATDRAEGRALIDRVVHLLRGTIPPLGPRVGVAIVDDDLGGPYPPPSRQPLLDALGAAGVTAEVELHPAAGTHPLVIALFGDIRAWKGRPGYSPAALDRVRQLVAAARARRRDVYLAQFSHPRLAAELPADLPVLCAWGGERAMQEAVARRLVRPWPSA